MKSIGQTVTTEQTEFNQAFVDIGPNKLVLDQTSMGIDLKSMRGTPVVRIWDASDGRGIQVETAKSALGRWVNTGQNVKPMNEPVYLHDELPDIEFVRVAPDHSIETELKRLGVL